jgi:hypothetical protein
VHPKPNSEKTHMRRHIIHQLYHLNQLPFKTIPNPLLLNKDVPWVNVSVVEIGIFLAISAKLNCKCSWDNKIQKMSLNLKMKDRYWRPMKLMKRQLFQCTQLLKIQYIIPCVFRVLLVIYPCLLLSTTVAHIAS